MQPLEILNKYNNWAVIGITLDQEKYGYKIYHQLKKINKNVYGVNPKYSIIDNDKIYSNLLDIDNDIDVVVMVVNPKIGISYLDEIKNKNIKYIWLQPGTESQELKNKANELNLNVIEACVLVVSNYIET
jgi:predicted CoA-binding protein